MGHYLWKICGKVKCPLRQLGYFVELVQRHSSGALQGILGTVTKYLLLSGELLLILSSPLHGACTEEALLFIIYFKLLSSIKSDNILQASLISHLTTAVAF